VGLENLFIEGPQFSETSMIKLPQSPQQWNEVIISLVKEKFPMVESLPMVVQFKEMSEDTGTAIGSVVITHPVLKKSCYLPLVVKGGMMFPLDVWQDEAQMVRPITEDTFETYFFNEKVFDQLEKKSPDPMGQYFSDPSLWNSTYPPLQGRYAYASAGGAMLGMMLENADASDLKSFVSTLEQAPGAVISYKKHGNLDLVKAASKLMEQPVQTKEEKKKALIPVSVTIRKDAKKYTVLSSHQGQFVTKATIGSQDEMQTWYSENSHLTDHGEDHLNDVSFIGEKSFKMPESGVTGVFIQDTLGPAPERVKKFGMYRVKRLNDGVIMKGLVVPHVIDFNQKSLGQQMFIGATNASMQTSVAGYPVETEGDIRGMLNDIKDTPIQVGQTGTFVLIDGEGALATEPIQIIRQEGQDYRAVNFAGKVFKVNKQYSHSGHDLQKITGYDNGNGFMSYSVPKKMFWVPINTFKPVSASGAEFMEKTAHQQKRDSDPLRVTFTGLEYQVLGKNFEKVATSFDAYSMQEHEVRFLSRALGASKEMSEEIIKVAKARGRAVVHGLKAIENPESLYKQADMVKQKVKSFCSTIKTNLVKEASEINDRQTVDSILSLNFINPDNVRKLVEAMPVMIKAHFKLAELVLAARLGAEDINHEAAIICMHRMTEVLKGLRLLDHSFSQVSTQSKDIAKAKKGKPSQNLVQVGAIG
jgi:hypothetical protein